MKLTILMPCLNEQKSISYAIKASKIFLKKEKIHGEILIADNGSVDNSVKIAKSLGCRVIHIKERGYGAALIGGIKSAKSEYIIFADCDGSYDFSKIKIFYNHLKNNYDFIIGNRFSGGIEKGAMPFLHKYLGNPVLSFLGKVFFNIKINDFHCGLRAIKKSFFLKLGIHCKGMEFASELVVVASYNNANFIEVPIKLHKDKRGGDSSHLRTWRDGWRHLKLILCLAPKLSLFYPGLIFLMITGLFQGFYLFNPNYLNKLLNINFSFFSTLYINFFNWLGLGMILVALMCFKKIIYQYKLQFQKKSLFNTLCNFESDSCFQIFGLICLYEFYLFIPMFLFWKKNLFQFFDINLFKQNIIVANYFLPFLFFFFLLGFVNYLSELYEKK